MKPTRLKDIAHAVGGRISGDGSATVRGAAVDSRIVRDGDLFFALQGKTDGTDFAGEAHLRGAVATVARRPLDVPTVVVEEPLLALQKLARWSLVRDDGGSGPRVVGITGSVGKTTTKDALAAILRSSGSRVSATEGNFNNEIGLPLTVLAAGENTEHLVLEMGATHRGDVAHLCEIAPPEVGILTAIAPVHLDSFGSLEGLAETKGELARALPETGAFTYPTGVPEKATGAGRSFGRSISFGRDRKSDLWASDVRELESGLSFTVHFGESSAEVRSPVFGTHLVEPLLAAIGGALVLDVDLEECASGLSRLRRTGLRGDLYRLRDDIVVYDDSYNASPTAVSAVLHYGAGQSEGRRLVAVLGGMFELGAGARAYHREIGGLAEELGVELLICVGHEARWYAETFTGDTLVFEDAEAAAEELGGSLKEGDYVVIKGSRGVGLDRLTSKLRENLSVV